MNFSSIAVKVFVILSLFLGCANPQPESFKSQNRDLLLRGKRVAYQPLGEGGSGAFLVGLKGVIDSKIEKGSDFVGWMIFDTSVMPKILEKDLLRSAFSFIDQNYHLFRVPSSELFPAANHRLQQKSHLTSINFIRKVDEIAVRDAFVEFIYLKTPEGFYLREIVNHSYGEIFIEESTQEADVAGYFESVGLSDIDILNDERVIFPEKRESGGYLFEYARTITLKNSDENIYTMSIKDGKNEPSELYSHRYDIEGTLKGNGYILNYKETNPSLFTMPFTDFLVEGDLFTTDFKGQFELEGEKDATIGLSSNRVNVFDDDSRKLIVFPESLGEGVKVLGEFPEEVKAINTFLAVHRVNSYVRQFLSEDTVPFLGEAVKAVINVKGSCNAYYDTGINSINFFLRGNGCADTALLNDVIYHEWGHALDFYTGRRGGIIDGAFSEGIGDIVASYITGSSVIGDGFFLNRAGGIRNTGNAKSFPEDQGQVHDEGLIIGSTFWDLKQALQNRYGETRGAMIAAEYFFRHLLTADSYFESYLGVLRLDDNDGNPQTPSPNYCLITSVFADHGLAEDDFCEDDLLKERPDVAKIFFGLKNDDEDGTIPMVSSDPGPKDVLLCFGDIGDCLTSNKPGIIMPFEGISKTGKFIFLGTAPIVLKEFSVVTLFARDDNGDILGYRTVKVVTR